MAAWSAASTSALRRSRRARATRPSHALIRFHRAMHAEWMRRLPRARSRSASEVDRGRPAAAAARISSSGPSWFLGKAYCCLGDYGRALAQLDRGDGGLRPHRRPGVEEPPAQHARLVPRARSAAIERAREYNERAAALAREVGDPEIVANSEINLAANHLALGDVERARATTSRRSRRRSRGPGDPWMRWRYALHAARRRRARSRCATRRPDARAGARRAELDGRAPPPRAQARGARARARAARRTCSRTRATTPRRRSPRPAASRSASATRAAPGRPTGCSWSSRSAPDTPGLAARHAARRRRCSTAPWPRSRTPSCGGGWRHRP